VDRLSGWSTDSLRASVACGADGSVQDLSMEVIVDEETLNLSIRKFLKTVGVSAQREIEHAVANAIAAGTISGTEGFEATMNLRVAGLQLDVRFDGEIRLQ
jgi:hypothetical protein